jgi:putative ABC transport system permease protein
MVAVATTVGISVMIESFRGSVSVWLEQILNADLYVAPAAVDSGDRNAVLLSDTVATLAGLPQVDQISLYRRTRVAYRDRRVEVIGAELAPRSRPGYHLLSSEAEAAWRDFDQGGIMISEPLAYHFGLQPGDALELTTPSAPRSFRIAGIFHDYGSEHGRILLRLRDYQTLWRDAQISSAALFVVPGTDLDVAAAAAVAAGGPTQSLLVSPSAELRRTSLRVFDRTFTITGVLRSLAVLIAFVGIFSALMALLLERSREFALLRATGLTGVELAKLLTLQTGLMGLAAGVMAIPTGLLMAAVLVGVIQQRAFGWSMQFSVPAETLFQAILIAGTAALLAVCYPAWRLARREPAQDLREE